MEVSGVKHLKEL